MIYDKVTTGEYLKLGFKSLLIIWLIAQQKAIGNTTAFFLILIVSKLYQSNDFIENFLEILSRMIYDSVTIDE